LLRKERIGRGGRPGVPESPPICWFEQIRKEPDMLGLILLIFLVLLLVGALPTWPHSRNWGYYPAGGLGTVLLILVVLLLLGYV